MLQHVAPQMRCVEGGLGDKLEDWVERQHQTGRRIRARFRNIVDHSTRAQSIAGAMQEASHPDIVAQKEGVFRCAARRGVTDTNKRKAEQRQQDRARRRLANLVHYENSLYNISTGGNGCKLCPSLLALRTTTCDEKEEGKA